MVAKAMELLETLSDYPLGLTVQEMVEKLKYPKTSVYKTACTLYEKGYLGRDRNEYRFFLSRKLLQLGLTALGETDIIDRSILYMKKLRDELGESIMIGTMGENEAVLLEQVTGTYDFVFTLKAGMRFNLYSTAPGKVMFAYSGEDVIKEKLRNIKALYDGSCSLPDPEVFLKELEKIRKEGFASDLEETVQGVHCIAAPVFNQSGKAVACVWTSGPSGRLPEKNIKEVALKIMGCAEMISRNLGYISK